MVLVEHDGKVLGAVAVIFTAPSHRQPGPDSVGVDGGGVDSIDGAADAAGDPVAVPTIRT